MSLDITLRINACPHCGRGDSVETLNVTHNLAHMADEAGVYDAVWQPEEHGISQAKQMVPVLRKGIASLRGDLIRFRQYNPDNGWGSYDILVPWLEKYLKVCEEHPDAQIFVCRGRIAPQSRHRRGIIMSKTTHTPGPWVAYDRSVYAKGAPRKENMIADCDTGNCLEGEIATNTHLMAAAPEMQALLEEIVEIVEINVGSSDNLQILIDVEKLLEKAREAKQVLAYARRY